MKPGQETGIRLHMVMHPGMEGAHLFQVMVPLERGGQPETPVELYVKGDFR